MRTKEPSVSGELDDNSASICPAEYPLPDSPAAARTMLPHGDSKNIAVEQHGERFLAIANEEVDVRMKRPHVSLLDSSSLG